MVTGPDNVTTAAASRTSQNRTANLPLNLQLRQFLDIQIVPHPHLWVHMGRDFVNLLGYVPESDVSRLEAALTLFYKEFNDRITIKRNYVKCKN